MMFPVLARLRSASRRLPVRLLTIALGLGGSLVARVADVAPGGLTAQPLAARHGPTGATMFTPMPSELTGIVTENNYADPLAAESGVLDPRRRADRHHEFSVGPVGTGVAVADFDGDGRPDLFTVSKTESCRLFRNLGDWKFEDVTDRAGVRDRGTAAAVWKQGATVADINNDGHADIYVCRFGAPNLLYVNRGDGTFREEAAARGLAVNDASVAGAFADYDRDGWIDVYVQTNLLDASARPNGQPDYLFHNNGDGTFTDVTARAGIGGETQGHSATWWDYDADGWPDLYVANDFAAPDSLYRNQPDAAGARFINTLDQVVPHTTYSSMGSDLGDVNNDGLIDLLVADMATTTASKDQRTMAAARESTRDPPEDATAPPQYVRSALFLNTGTGRCLEAAFLAGVAATDWTWAPRLEDWDNDGRIDLLVTNGMHREAHNTDLIQRLAVAPSLNERVRIERASPVLVEENLAFRNLGELQFEPVGRAWGFDEKGVSFGLAAGDFDADGDLDVVYTNYRKGVTVLRNDEAAGHRVIVQLRATRSNRLALGATVEIETAAGRQIRPLVSARGVLSSSEPMVHFGLGAVARIERLRVSWPSGAVQEFTDLAADQRLVITEPAGPQPGAAPAPAAAARPQFTAVDAPWVRSLLAREQAFDELGANPLLPVRHNRRGPALALGDLNADGRDDLCLGGTPLDAARILWAGGEGGFEPAVAAALGPNPPVNDGPILIFDANHDDANDVLVTRGGVALPPGSPGYQPVLLLNDGHGTLQPAPDGTLPALPLCVGATAAADYDRDGYVDVFLGGRVVPGLYPTAPRSALLRMCEGRLVDVTDDVAPALRRVGLVTSALWSDVDQDGWPDLLVALEGGPVRFFRNDHGAGFTDRTDAAGFGAAGTGWWSSLVSGDFNGDGRLDYVAGNTGLNTQYQASPDRPALLFAGDFGGRSAWQLLEARWDGERLVPWRSRRQLGAAIPSILKRFPRNDVYANASLAELVGTERLNAAQRFAATELRSGVFLSRADGTFGFQPLPRIAQIAPIKGMCTGDFDGDGCTDLYVVQNSFAPAPVVGRMDGGLSQLLRGDGRGGFLPVPAAQSGLVVPGDAMALAALDIDDNDWADFLVTRNHARALAFVNAGNEAGRPLRVSLRGPSGNRGGIGARVVVRQVSGRTQTAEVCAGSGHASQAGTVCFFGSPTADPVQHVEVHWPGGGVTGRTVAAGTRRLEVSAE